MATPQIKVIDNKVPYNEIRRIPKTRKARQKYIKTKLSVLNHKYRSCPALNGLVYFYYKYDPIKKREDGSIVETAYWASKSHKSAVCALNLSAIISNATLIQSVNPKPAPGNQTSTFHFTKVHILYTKVRYYGVAKLTIGEQKTGNLVHYCVSSIKIK